MAILFAGGALALIVFGVAWNTLGVGGTLTPPVERAVAGGGLALSIAALWFADGLGESAAAMAAFVISGVFFGLTFASRLPWQQPAATVGQTAPEFVVMNVDRTEFRLSSLRGTSVLLKFFRGSWCPYCVAELRDYDAHADDFASIGVRVVAVSPDRTDELVKLARSRPWRIVLLADPSNSAAVRYNLQNRNFTPKRGPFRELVIPSSILVDADGIVRWIDMARDFRQRASAASVLAQVRGVLAAEVDERRPDVA
jgi:peroxiredoxin